MGRRGNCRVKCQSQLVFNPFAATSHVSAVDFDRAVVGDDGLRNCG